jgi:exopolysaccharide biosynthesis WecB/TagA/CpsF family protein
MAINLWENVGGEGRSAMKDLGGSPMPPKYNVIGVHVSATTYDQAIDFVIHSAKASRSACVSHLAVHGLVEGSRDSRFRSILNEIDIVAPDGQPVRHALNILHKTRLQDRCCGPEFMLRLCESAVPEGIGVYLYGSQPHVVETLGKNLVVKYPGLRIVGCEPSVFRPLTTEEDEALLRRINESGAGIVFLGLGCPLQERFAHERKSKINAVQICVGAAFDFHAGAKKMAPMWMQRGSLEWLFRLFQEPRRLWRRYLVTNSLFLWKFFLQVCGFKKFSNNDKG